MIVIILILIFFVKIKVALKTDNNRIHVAIFLLGVISLYGRFVIRHEKKEIFTLYRVGRKGEKKVISLYDLLQRTKKLSPKNKLSLKNALVYIYRKTYFDIRLDMSIGINDAYATARLCGWLGVLSGTAAALYNGPRHAVKMKIRPLFSQQNFSLKADCIIALSPVNIIIGYVKHKKSMRR